MHGNTEVWLCFGLGWVLTVLRTTACIGAAAATYVTAAGVGAALTPAYSKHHQKQNAT